MDYRERELDQHKSIWLTQQGYSLLRKQKKEQKKTMARIVDNLIIEKYDNTTSERTKTPV